MAIVSQGRSDIWKCNYPRIWRICVFQMWDSSRKLSSRLDRWKMVHWSSLHIRTRNVNLILNKFFDQYVLRANEICQKLHRFSIDNTNRLTYKSIIRFLFDKGVSEHLRQQDILISMYNVNYCINYNFCVGCHIYSIQIVIAKLSFNSKLLHL